MASNKEKKGDASTGLTMLECKNAMPKEKAYKLPDRLGLYLMVWPNGSKSWRFNFRFGGTVKTLTYGKYPDLNLKDARELHLQAKLELAKGVNPIETRKQAKDQQIREEQEKTLTWRKVCMAWFNNKMTGKSKKTRDNNLARLENYVLANGLGEKAFADVTFDDLKGIIRKLEARNAYDLAGRVCNLICRVCAYARAERWCDHNLAEGLTEIKKPRPLGDKQSRPAIVSLEGVRDMLLKIDDFIERPRATTPWMCAALQISPLVALRGSELTNAKWSEIDLVNGIWTIPADRMKERKEHRVFLSTQAKAILQALVDKEQVQNDFVFYSFYIRGHITVEGLNKALHLTGIPKGEMCHHGWRSVLSTLAHEALAPHILIEKALSHAIGDAVVQAYNRSTYDKHMRVFMQWWADFLDALKADKPLPKYPQE